MFTERRGMMGNDDEQWDQLSLAQKFAMNELNHYGYQLAYIREQKGDTVAIALQDDRAATISSDGDINLSPEIHFRK